METSVATPVGSSIGTSAASRLRQVFSFPDPVNEVSARVVAGGVVMLASITLALGLRWGPAVLAAGFLARVLTGPTLSPLGQLATRVITPRLPVPAKPVPGPPKRFAQTIGLTVATTAAVLSGVGLWGGAQIALGLLVLAALLESAAGICLGCHAFAFLMRVGVIPPSVCERCADIRRVPQPAT